MGAEFYRAFEERYRGSRELIKWRLRSYLPFIEPIKVLLPDAPGLDLGCGRGEWLELLLEVGIPARGVDLDDAMLASCRKRDLEVATQDALAALREQADASHAIISAFHLVEHLPFEAISDLVREAFRVLQPGGLLIMETPNPENIAVASNSFYLDPTHIRPIPSLLLAFIPEYVGFQTVKTVRLQEAHDLLERDNITLADVLTAVSPDYAIVAQKAAAEEAPPIAAFEQPFGVSLEDLLDRYHAGRDHADAEQAAARAAADARAAARLQRAEEQLQQLEERMRGVEVTATHAAATLEAIYISHSWRITRPLRAVSTFCKRLMGRGRA